MRQKGKRMEGSGASDAPRKEEREGKGERRRDGMEGGGWHPPGKEERIYDIWRNSAEL